MSLSSARNYALRASKSQDQKEAARTAVESDPGIGVVD